VDELADLLGQSPAIEHVRAQIRRLTARQATSQRLPPVLIHGETGTGKGLIARIFHRASARARGPFVDVNCAAIPDALLEAELFGYERGAFTDARQAKAGLFQSAHHGTLFLDEIGLLAETLQAKLLKAIEERVVRRLGGTRNEPFDAWLICATNEDLATAIREHRFREDLYHRIAVFTLRLPPLRERGEDVALLAEEFLRRACADYGLDAKTLAPDARARLLAYPWPGNIRELSNLMERVALLSEQPLVTGDMLSLPEGRPAARESAPARAVSLDEAMRDHLLSTLEERQWNISRTAEALGISRNTVRARIARFGLRPGETPLAWREPGAVPHPAAAPSAPAAPATPALPPFTTVPRPPPPGDPTTIRWERRQIAFLRASLIAPPGGDTLLDTTRVLETLVEKVRTFAGHVEEVSPTSVGAVFGLEALEEAPRRAAHAAMAMQRAIARGPIRDAPAFAARLGVHVAQLLVNRASGPPEIDADGKRAAWTALDALLEGVETGTVAVTAAAAPLLERRFALAPLPSGDPAAYRLLGPERTGLRAGGRMASFVGRRQELALLESRLAAAITGNGQVIGIAGEAGIGKSRLLHEFRQRLRGRRVAWLEAHCVSYGSEIPYLPLLDLLRHGCRLGDGDTPEVVVRKVHRALERIDIDPSEAAPYLLQFLGMKPASGQLDVLSPEAVRSRTLSVVRRMTIQASRRRPLIIVVEDLHWVDAGSTTFAPVIDGLERIPVLILLTYRPGYTLPWLDRSSMTQIALQRLNREESAAIVDSVLGSAPVPEPVASLIIQQAEGNPFFIEELARAMVEQHDASPPATIHQLLLSRINRLPDDAKRLLEATAVLGRQASLRLLEAMWPDTAALGALLGDLVRHEFLYLGSTAGDETTYAFKHALTQEVAYQNLLAGERRRLHAAAGAALETLSADRVDEVIELLAHHFGESDVDDKAVDYAIRAGEKAIRRWANAEAIAAFDAALSRLDRMPGTESNRLRRIDAVLKQSEVRFALGQHAEHLRALEAVRDLVEGSVDPVRRATWYYWMGFLHDLTGAHPDVTIAFCQEAATIAATAGLRDIGAFVDSCLAEAYFFRGDLQKALDAGERALALFESRGNAWWACRTLWHLIVTNMAIGGWALALDHCRRALAHAEASDDRRLKVRTLYLTGSVHIQRGDPARGLESCELALALAPLPFDRNMIRAIRGYGLVKSGNVSGGIAELREAVAWFTTSGLRFSRAITALRLAEALLRQRDVDEARSVLGRVLDDVQAAGYRPLEGVAHRLLGDSFVASDEKRADEHLDRAAVLFQESGARNELAKVLVSRAERARRSGRPDEARAWLHEALTRFEALGTLDGQARARSILAEIESTSTG